MSTQALRRKRTTQCHTVAYVVILMVTGAGACMPESGGDGSTLPFSDILDGLGTIAPTTSDNNSNEPTSPDPGSDDPVGSVGDGGVEAKVLELVNTRRKQGADCGGEGTFASAAPLASNEVLATIARNHSTDMSVRGFFDHTNPDGDGPGERIAASTYQWSTWGENIAAGHRTAEDVVEGWMNSDGHCSNIMNPAFTEIGIGYEANGSHWTQVFGAQR